MTIGFFAKTNLKKEKWIRGKGMFLKITHATGMGNQKHIAADKGEGGSNT